MRTSLLVAIGLALGSSLITTTARAEYMDAAPVRPFNLPDLSGLTALELDMQYTAWTQPLPLNAEQDITSVTFDLSADIQIAPHWVIVARLPLVYANIDSEPVDTDCCGFGLGNITLGVRGLVSSAQGSEWRSVLGGELALSLATAGDDGDDGTAALLAAVARQPHDPGRYLPNTWTPRLTGHGQLYNRWLLLQVEAGLHFFLYDDDALDDDSDIGLRVGLAAGIRLTQEFALLAELNNMILLTDNGGGDDTSSSLDLGVRYGAEHFLFGARLYLPISDAARDVDMIGFGLDIGARF